MAQAIPSAPVAMPDLDPRFLARHGIVPLELDDARLVVAMADPGDTATIAALAFAAQREIVVRAAEIVPPPVATPSLFGRIGAAFGDAAVTQCVRVDAHARLVADGATPAAALARVEGEVGPIAPIDWAGPVDRLADPRSVAGQLRAELDMGLAVRMVAIPVGMVLVLALLAVGWWGLVPAAALIGLRGVPAMLATARAAGRAAALGRTVDPAGLTPAERDRGDVAGVRDRARLMLLSAGGRVTAAMLLMLAMLAVVRLG